MSLVKTLAKVALGVAVAKGVSGMMKGGSARARTTQSNGGLLGGLADALGGQQTTSRSGGGLEDMLGQVLGGQKGGGASQSSGGLGGLLDALGQSQPAQKRASSGGLGDLLGSLSKQGNQGGGGLGDLLGQLTGGGQGGGGSAASGGLGGLLGALAGGASAGNTGSGGLTEALGGLLGQGSQPSNDRSFGDVLNGAMANRGEPEVAPTPEQNAMAGLMLKAMIQAAKSDGKLDANEQKKLMGNLQDASEAERAFVQQELQSPVDVARLARAVPPGLEAQVYTMSVMAIDLDSQAEAQYLHQLAQAMGLDQGEVNQVHAQLGVPALYA